MLIIRKSIVTCFLFSIILSLLIVGGGCKSKEDYKKEVELKGVAYSRDSFQTEIIAGNKETIKLFIKAGMNVNDHDPVSDMTPLMFATAKSHVDIMKLLLDHGADVNMNTHGYTALTGALMTERSSDVIKLLLDKGANVNVIPDPESGMTALMIAVSKGHSDIIKMLIDKGADVNVKRGDDLTALKYASEASHYDVVALLKKAGAVQ